MRHHPPSDRSLPSVTGTLLERIRDGDDAAWTTLSERYVPLVYHWCREAGLQEADAADIVQNVFRIVARRLNTFRSEHGGASFTAWLWSIARNELRGHYRQAARRPEAAGGSAATLQIQQAPDWIDDETINAPALHLLLRQAMRLVQSDFEPQTWQAFWRTAVGGEPATEVAAALHMSPTAVRQAKYRVLCRLRQEMES